MLAEGGEVSRKYDIGGQVDPEIMRKSLMSRVTMPRLMPSYASGNLVTDPYLKAKRGGRLDKRHTPHLAGGGGIDFMKVLSDPFGSLVDALSGIGQPPKPQQQQQPVQQITQAPDYMGGMGEDIQNQYQDQYPDDQYSDQGGYEGYSRGGRMKKCHYASGGAGKVRLKESTQKGMPIMVRKKRK